MTDTTVTRHPSGVVSVSGMVTDRNGERLATFRIVPDGRITDADATAAWREHIDSIGARPV